MCLSWAQVLCLPLDVSNSRGDEGGFRMDILWQVVYIATAIDLVFVNPALSFYYEADEDDSFVIFKNNYSILFLQNKIVCKKQLKL